MSRLDKKYRVYRKAALALAVIMLAEAFHPVSVFALTGGPSSPEFASFEPVATTSMVSDFSGDFTYNLPVLNVPGANGGGYSMSLSYHSGDGMESEASWVGFGWTLNPGAINRNKRGFADDSKGDPITYRNQQPDNVTVGVGPSLGLELFSGNLAPSVSTSLRYNNYKGYGTTSSFGLGFKDGLVSLGYSISDGDGSFSAKVNPGALIKKKSLDKEKQKLQETQKYKEASPEEQSRMLKDLTQKVDKQNWNRGQAKKGLGSLGAEASSYGLSFCSDAYRSTNVGSYHGKSVNVSVGLQVDPGPIPVGLDASMSGYVNRQEYVPTEQVKTYGYLYSGHATDDDIMDYYSEGQDIFNKRDKWLSIPFSNADNFSVTGEGLAGGFRLHSRHVGHFHQNTASSKTNIYQAGGEVQVGLAIGGGGDLGIGDQTLSVKNGWTDSGNDYNGNTNSYQFLPYSPNEYFFRFSGDLGGDVLYGQGTDDAQGASLVNAVNTPGLRQYRPNVNGSSISTTLSSTVDNVSRSGASSYIGYHTNSEMLAMAGSIKYNTYDKNALINSTMVDRSSVPDGIGEIATYNEAGNRYVYGLPVYAKNEVSMSYSLEGVPAGNINHNAIAYHNYSGSSRNSGEESTAPYATSYLLTEITTPDFVDRQLDGPDSTDFGGWTKFSYRQKYGAYNKTSGGNWYRWRLPFNGLKYNAMDRTDNTDDMGSLQSGDKEVYYLQTIETKTHVAVFITNKTNFSKAGVTFNGQSTLAGSNSDRLDAIEAAADPAAAASSSAKGTDKLEYLERIELYAKDDVSHDYKLVRTVRFKYDYSLCKNAPNNTSSAYGKLTLKKIWFEYEGITNARISPYQFEYAYPATDYPAPYNSLENYGGFSGAEQNPDYNIFASDCWGNFHKNGTLRHDSLRTWVDQTPPTGFDPAAWQLKVIKLPSGGEIHVQYEQKDYLYVQNRRAMAMVSLSSAASNSKFYLNVENDLGVLSSTDKTKLVSLINNQFEEDKIYFKFFYQLFHNGVPVTPTLGSCTSDFVSGYANLFKADIDPLNGKIYIQLTSGLFGSNYELPNQVCEDYVVKEKSGKLKPLNNCNASDAGIGVDGDPKDLVYSLLAKAGTIFAPSNMCATMEPKLSYFRIPVLNAKKGGGVRVKRILMYDKGIDSGDAVLYGSEYLYTDANGISSGVATNEPGQNREENALVTFLPRRNDQTLWQKIISGRDKDQFEGPLGESLLPAPSVGYRRVVIKNIHSGKTNTGFAVNEYYTTYDYPFDKFYNTSAIYGNGVAYTDMNQEQDIMIIPAWLVNIKVSNLWRTQGYRFIQNEMNGKMRRTSTYAGDYASINNPNLCVLTSQQSYTYFEPGESIPMMDDLGTINYRNPGKETEIVMERKSVDDVSRDGNIEFDAGVGVLLFPLPFGSMFPSVSYSESRLKTHVTSKVISYPAIVKSTTYFQDGIYHKSENVAFSPSTGQPLITRATDGFHDLDVQLSSNHDGSYHSYTIPASQQYREMGQKAAGERRSIDSTAVLHMATSGTAPNYKLAFTYTGTSSTAMCELMSSFSKGDLLRISGCGGNYFFHVDGMEGNEVSLLKAGLLNSSVATCGTVSTVEIVRSGRTNQLSAAAGAFTTYGAMQNPSLQWTNPAQYTALQTLITGLNPLADTNSSYVPTVGLMYEGCQTSNMSIVSVESGTNVTFSLYYGGTVLISSQTFPSGGSFGVNSSNGDLVYYPPGNSCFPIKVTFLVFCDSTKPFKRYDVVASSASQFAQVWPYDLTLNPAPSGANVYEIGERGKWRLSAGYAYNDTIVPGSWQGTTSRIYKRAGVYPMDLFNWKAPELNDTTSKWIRTSLITQYSPNGEAIEEKDALHIYSSAKFGYYGMLPYLVAQNATYSTVQFESFENVYSGKVEEGLTLSNSGLIDNAVAHSGRSSYRLKTDNTTNASQVMKTASLNGQVQSNGLSVKVWVRDQQYANMPLAGTVKRVSSGVTKPLTFSRVARVGEWELLEAKYTDWAGYSLFDQYEIKLSSNSPIDPTKPKTIWIDDVRVQPYDAKVMNYVYDTRTFRLLATFDDQHFGMYYQYNAEGKLVRKQIETERGMKTVQETQYHTPLQNR